MRNDSLRRSLIILLAALLGAPLANASELHLFGLLCNTGSGGSPDPSLCGDTAVGGEVPGNPFGGTVLSPDFKNTAGGVSETFGAGAEGLSAQAYAGAGFGHLQVLASAHNPIGTPDDINFHANAVARSQAQMVDRAVVDGPAGSIAARISLDVAGSFGGSGDLRIGFFLSSSLQGTLVNLETSRFVGFADAIDRDFDFTVVDGEELFLRMFLDASASAPTSNGKTPFASSFVDASHSALLHIELLTPGATLTAASGHVYSVAPVPLPPAGLLMGPLTLATLYVRRRV